MEENVPLISILLAVYEPRLEWLAQQLASLNAQSYPRLRLYVRDDCSPTVPFAALRALLAACITAFPYTVARNERNLGSTATFERLTGEAEGDYFAYCDQDDIWLPGKLALSAAQIGSAGLLCGDVIPIDAQGRRLADSLRALRPGLVFREGAGLGGGLIYKNFVIGCTMLVQSRIAKAALPFARSMVHDHYLAWYCAQENEIAVASQPLVYYRQHAGNQTGVLTGIVTKEDYLRVHLGGFAARVEELSQRAESEELRQAAAWARARRDNAARARGAVRRLWALRRVNVTTTLFELIALRLPEPLFRRVIRLLAGMSRRKTNKERQKNEAGAGRGGAA